MRRNIELTIVLGLFVLGVFWFRSMSNNGNARLRARSCQSNLREIAKAMNVYTQDYGTFPRVASSNTPGARSRSAPYYGWADTMVQYAKCHTCFYCPEEPQAPESDPHASQFTDFWFNGNLGGKKPQSVAIPSQTLLMGDGNQVGDNTNARYSLNRFPPRWLKEKTSPLYRHMEGANYLFTDGQVRWLKPQEIEHYGSRSNPFSLR